MNERALGSMMGVSNHVGLQGMHSDGASPKLVRRSSFG
jgi:hypothetical protein